MHLFRGIEKAISKVVPHQHSADRRAALGAAKEQMEYYKSSKEEMHKENEKVAAEKHLEQQKIHEKQIRGLRRNYRAPGFLGTESDAGTSDTLG